MGEIRVFTEEHLPDVAALYWRMMRGHRGAPAPAVAGYFREIFMGSPWTTPDIPSLVYLDKSRLVGFLGVIPRADDVSRQTRSRRHHHPIHDRPRELSRHGCARNAAPVLQGSQGPVLLRWGGRGVPHRVARRRRSSRPSLLDALVPRLAPATHRRRGRRP